MNKSSHVIDVVIIGAGAAGLMCAIEAGKRGRRVLVLDHANKVGKKILMSGGGRCNFTNENITPNNYLSHNPHFCKSALSRYTQWDFLDLVKKHQILFHEKKQGQLFCDHKSKDIVDMLLAECEQVGVEIRLNTDVNEIQRIDGDQFMMQVDKKTQLRAQSLVIATGGLSIPTMGASPFGYQVARQFDIPVWPTRAGLVPFTLHPQDKASLSVLSGVANDCIVYASTDDGAQSFRENLLFTHRGLSGPAMLQISSYWDSNEEIRINLLPEINVFENLKVAQKQSPTQSLKTILGGYLNKRVVSVIVEYYGIDNNILDKKLAMFSYSELEGIAHLFHQWCIKPGGTEGYRTAEVTLGGVDCDALSSKTMESNTVSGLYFIGEVVDVSGWLGGYNFQWAWSSGWAAGQVV